MNTIIVHTVYVINIIMITPSLKGHAEGLWYVKPNKSKLIITILTQYSRINADLRL